MVKNKKNNQLKLTIESNEEIKEFKTGNDEIFSSY